MANEEHALIGFAIRLIMSRCDIGLAISNRFFQDDDFFAQIPKKNRKLFS